MSYTGPGTFLAFALMTLAVLPTAFVYAEFSTMFQVQVRVWYLIRLVLTSMQVFGQRGLSCVHG